MTFSKRESGMPPDFYPVEAAGLHWLGAAADGVAVADVLKVTGASITLPRYATISPTREAARAFGRDLARTHRAGADHHGVPPPGVVDGYIATLPLPHLTRPPKHWGAFYASCRLEPFAAAAAASGALGPEAAADVQAVCDRLHSNDVTLTGPEVPAARLHGDLWSGNVLWTTDGARLIDPAAHGGHPETDLAMLTLFGLPHLDDVLSAYVTEAPLAPGWTDRVGLHQLHPLLVHAVLFGGSYGSQAGEVARRYR